MPVCLPGLRDLFQLIEDKAGQGVELMVAFIHPFGACEK